MRKFDNMSSFYSYLSIRPQFVAQHVEKSKFISTPYCKIVSTWMKRQCYKWFSLAFFQPEIEHSQQFTTIIFIVPNSYCTVLMATCGKKWSLQTQIHTSDRMIMKTFVQILKENIFTISIFGDVSNLWHKLVQENCRNIIVSERNGQHILF